MPTCNAGVTGNVFIYYTTAPPLKREHGGTHDGLNHNGQRWTDLPGFLLYLLLLKRSLEMSQ